MPSGTSASIESTFCNSSAVRTDRQWCSNSAANDSKCGGLELQPGGGLVAAKGDQAGGARRDRLVQVEARDRAGRSLADSLAESDDDRRAVIGIDQAAGHDADDAGMPPRASEDDRAPIAQPPLPADHRVRLGHHRAARPPVASCCSDRAPRRARGATAVSPVVSISTAIIARSSRPAALIRGASPNPTIPGRQPLLAQAAADLQKRLLTLRRAVEHPLETVPDEDPILVPERHDVGDRRQRHQADRLDQEVAEVGRRFLAVAEALADLPGDLERHAGAAEVGAGIAAPLEPGVDDHVRLGQLGADRVVIGDDELEAQLTRQAGLGDGRDTAIDRDDQLGPLLAPEPRSASPLTP